MRMRVRLLSAFY